MQTYSIKINENGRTRREVMFYVRFRISLGVLSKAPTTWDQSALRARDKLDKSGDTTEVLKAVYV